MSDGITQTLLGLAGILSIYLGAQLFRFLKEKEFEFRLENKGMELEKRDLRWAKAHSLFGGVLLFFIVVQDALDRRTPSKDVVVIDKTRPGADFVDPYLENSGEFKQLLGIRDLVRLETSDRAVPSLKMQEIKAGLYHLVHEKVSRQRLDQCHNWNELKAFVEEYLPYYHWAYSQPLVR